MKLPALPLRAALLALASSLACAVGVGPQPPAPLLPAVAGHRQSAQVAPLSPCASRSADLARPAQPGRGDRVVLASRGARRLAYVAQEDDGSIHTLDLDSRAEIAVTPLRGSPSAIVGLADGRLAVALRDANEVLVLEPDELPERPLAVRCRRAVLTEPVGLGVVSTDGAADRLVVTSGAGQALTVLGTEQLQPLGVYPLRRDPRAVLVRGERVFVSHVTSSELSVIDVGVGTVTRVDALRDPSPPGGAGAPKASAREEQPRSGGQAFSLATDGASRLFAPMVTVDPGPAKPTSFYGGAERPIHPFVGVIDIVAQRRVPVGSAKTGGERRECTLPRAAAATPDGRLFVTCAGTDELLELDGRADNAALHVRRRVRVGAGPLGLAVHGDLAVVLSSFDREVALVDVASAASEVRRIALSRPAAGVDPELERGREIFHDSFDLRVSADGRACASCHPDGRDDAQTWSTPDGPRQTIPLAGRVVGTAPYGWFGANGTLRAHLEQTTRRLGGQGFVGPDLEDLAALQTYLTRMRGPSPAPPGEPALVDRGRALFHEAKQGCGTCHTAGATDLARHDVGSGHADEASRRFDTPSLVGAASSGPYFHDGRYPSLEDVLERGDDKMGHTRHLDASERAALVAYMTSLGGAPTEPRDEARLFVAAPMLGPLEPDAASALEREALAASPPRRPLESTEIALADLPSTTRAVLLSADAWDRKTDAPSGGERGEPLAWHRGCAAVPHHDAAFLRLDWRSTGMTRKLERCVHAPDEDGARRWEVIVTRTVDRLEGGNIRFAERVGFIHLTTREIRVIDSVSSEAAPILDGLAFAFRETCEACAEGERDVLHVVAPTDSFRGDELFSSRRLSLEPGRASRDVATVLPWRLPSWEEATGVAVDTGSAVGDPWGYLLRFEATRTFTEELPRVIAGRARCRASSWDCT